MSIGGGTTLRVDSLASTKSRAALALAVSLWTATGGVASAESIVDVYINADDNTQPIQHEDHFDQSGADYPASVTEPTKNSNTQFTVTGDWSQGPLNDNDWYFYGGYSAAATDVAGYSLVLDRAKVARAYGGYSVQGKATGNRVTLTDSDADYVYGGYTGNASNTGGDASHNEVRLTRSTAGYVAGGVFYDGTNNATYNKVYLTDSTVNGPVFGGEKANGGGDLVTGNELYLSGANTVIHNGLYRPGKVQNFETIFIENVKWGTPVLTFSQIVIDENPKGITQNADGSWATIDASKLKFDNPETIANGKMMNLINGPVGDVTLAAATTAKQEYTVAPVTGVTVNAAFQGKLSIPDAKNALVCTAENKATKLTFGSVAWGGTLIDHSKTLTNISFDGAAVDTSNISFTNVNSLASGDSMTLVSAFGTRVGTITGSAFSVGSLTGAGHAYFENNNLRYLVTEGTGGNTPDPDPTPTGDSDVSGETKTAPQGKTTGNITGASTGSGTATSNTAEVPGGAEVTGNITGAVTGSGEAKENAANVTGGTVTGDVAGAVTTDGVANSNSATVSGGGTVTGSVTGAGAKGSGTANGNQASVSGPNTTVTGSVTGAVTAKGAAAENTAEVSGGSTVTGDVAGAVTGENGAAVANSAVVSGSEIKVKGSGTKEEEGGDVIGAATANGTASQNTATVTDSVIAGNVCGGNSETGEVNTNTAIVSGGTVKRSVFGGHTEGAKAADANRVVLENEAEVKGSVYGGKSDKGASNGNVVEISKATVDGYVFGAVSKNASTNNSVAMADGLVSGLVGGGCEVSTGNSVTVTGGIVREYAVGGLAGATATDNTVLMTGGYVLNGVYGGYGKTTAASGNNVYLGGGTVIGGTTEDAATIEGFTLKDKGVYGGYSESGTTRNNSVTLYGTANVSTADLYGGNWEATGNILHIGGVVGSTPTPWTGGGNEVNSISNFEKVSFDVVKWNTPALVVRNGVSNFFGTISAENVVFIGTESLEKGNVMTLAKNLPATAKVETASAFTTTGTTTEGTGTVSLDNQGNASYTVDSVSASRQSHNTVMAAEVGMAALSMGNDFIGSATEGLTQAANLGADGVSTFARMGGGNMRQEMGSHVDTHIWNAILALGHQNKKERGTTEYGAFFEYGTGNYTTHNDDSQRGDGSAKYTGGGLLAKWTACHGFYVEGSLRAGTIHDDARNMLRDFAGNGYSYDTNANYFGAHLGVGKEISMANGNTVDVYGKYFYNRKNGVSFDAGGHYDLDAVTSQIIRIGARYTIKRDKWDFYAGAAYEHELDGKANGTAGGLAIRGADTSGASFRGELGATMKPGEKSPWSLDLNVAGFAGKKQGFTGGVSVAFMF